MSSASRTRPVRRWLAIAQPTMRRLKAFRPTDEEPVDVVQVLKEAKAEVLVCYMPVGPRRRHSAIGYLSPIDHERSKLPPARPSP